MKQVVQIFRTLIDAFAKKVFMIIFVIYAIERQSKSGKNQYPTLGLFQIWLSMKEKVCNGIYKMIVMIECNDSKFSIQPSRETHLLNTHSKFVTYAVSTYKTSMFLQYEWF